MKRSLLLALLLNVCVIVSAQTPLWVKSIGNAQMQLSDRTVVDANGNFYISGRFAGSNVDFDPSPTATFLMTAQGAHDGYVAKYDPNGNFLWAFRFGGASLDDFNARGGDVVEGRHQSN
ncbi:MAG: hypothetical protein EOP49_17930, partial [Sphingobacteriales bacterium]